MNNRPEQPELDGQHGAGDRADREQHGHRLDQRRASAVQRGSPVRSPRHSAASISHGIPTPRTANTMWKLSESSICLGPLSGRRS